MGEKGIGKKNWALIWILGIAGQLCWSVEGSWFNNFVYEKIAPDPSIVAWMVAVSATTTTLATFLVGTWGDRAGRRRPFVAAGYLLWGLFTILYGTAEFLPKSPLVLAATFVVAADGIMSFFGSTGFHGAFLPWTTDISNVGNRGRVGGALAAAPVIASILAATVSGIVIDALDFFAFFTIIGALVMAIGVLSLVLLRDDPALAPRRDPGGYFKQLLSIFRMRTVLENRELFWLFVVLVLYNIAFNVYFPYISIYLVNFAGLSYSISGVIQGVGLLLAVLFTIPASRRIDRGRAFPVLLGAVAINSAGLLLVAIAGKTSLPLLVAGVFGAGLGYVLVNQTLSAWVKNLLPEGSFGQFEGVRLVFSVCVPMIIGPAIATAIINNLGVAAVSEGGATGMVPSPALFWIAAALTLLVLLPLIPVRRLRRAREAAAATLS